MNATTELEDIELCVLAARQPRAGMRYRIKIANGNLQFMPFEIGRAEPTGRELLDAAGLHPVDEYVIFQLLKDGLMEDLGLEQRTDLCGRGVEKFIAFQTDRIFIFELDGKRLEWGAPFISGLTLKKLAGVDPATYGVWLEVRGGDDQLISNKELADLSRHGVERFFTGKDKTTEGAAAMATLPMRDRRYLEDRGLKFDEVEEGQVNGVVLRGFNMPAKRLNSEAADILIVLPSGYADSPPDMFYTLPWLRLTANGQYPVCADQSFRFGGQEWQRWSRHNNEWRRGVDGIWTMIKRVETALAEAA